MRDLGASAAASLLHPALDGRVGRIPPRQVGSLSSLHSPRVDTDRTDTGHRQATGHPLAADLAGTPQRRWRVRRGRASSGSVQLRLGRAGGED